MASTIVTAKMAHATPEGQLLPVAQNSPRLNSESSVIQTVSTFCMVVRQMTPIAVNSATGM
jgi:hypothetical protein